MNDIQIDGVPFYLITNDEGFYVYAVAAKVGIHGSPVVVRITDANGMPLAPTVDAGAPYQAIKAKLPA